MEATQKESNLGAMNDKYEEGERDKSQREEAAIQLPWWETSTAVITGKALLGSKVKEIQRFSVPWLVLYFLEP